MLKETFSYSGGPEFNAAISRVTLAVATQQDREVIYQIRHVVYAGELGQYLSNPSGRLTDRLDDWNIYLVAKNDSKILGFISITPPRRPSYSIDKYFDRAQLPFACTDALFEIRLLTVVAAHRRRALALLLMYAAFRWVESHGGEHVVAIGRRFFHPPLDRVERSPQRRRIRFDHKEQQIFLRVRRIECSDLKRFQKFFAREGSVIALAPFAWPAE